MTGTIYTIDAANMFCGDDDPTNGKAILITSVKLPAFTETFADHKPGGSRFSVKLSMGIEALECSFKFHGYDPEMVSIFGLGQRGRRKFTVRHKLVDQFADTDKELEVIMLGRLGKHEKDEYSRGDLHGVDYMISGILQYQEIFDGVEKVYWNFFTNSYRVDGVDQNASENAILGIG